MPAAATADVVAEAIEKIVRHDGGRLLSLLVAILRDFQLAEDSFQDALESALLHWQRSGVPASPSAWLMRTAQRKAIDRIRRAASFRTKSAELAALIALDNEAIEPAEDNAIADERLKLIFTCCHPALERQTSVALTLRSIGGLKTEEIARAYLVSHDSMAQRLVRARHKIVRAGIPYEVPGPEGWRDRLDAVLAVIYLIFNEGYAASSEQHLRVDLCEEAIRLCRILLALIPHEAEVEGLLALMLLHRSRFVTRMGAPGEIITLERQNRSGWDRKGIEEGAALLVRALRRGRPGSYQLQAAIAAVHAEAESFAATDWQEIALIYDALIAVQPNPVFELNRIVALSYAKGPEAALTRLGLVGAALASYQPYHAVRADILARLGEVTLAREAFDAAIRLSGTDAERKYLMGRRDELAMPE
ncbi:RNA polymerase sigma-70 factor (ECF subfamily) [Mesorhizobium robiniae]|uniref:RNA polymerase sigma-70 factor (ECF subfamily) n=1 Tax=Mesorhizobium robiniae TaxID=559315 RepID=A0ABV2GT49_9HYPH